MGNRDKGGKEVKKPKKAPAKEARPLSTEPTYSTTVDVVPRKRKTREDDE